jgi:hypothetical protein
VRKDFVDGVIADTSRVGIIGIDLFAGAERRLSGVVGDVRIGIDISVWKGAVTCVAFPLVVGDESAEYTTMVGLAAGIDPASTIDGTV